MNKRIGNFIFIFVFVFMLSVTARAEIFFAYLTPAQENPPVASSATGYCRVFVNESTNTLNFTLVFNNLTSNQILSHIHTGAIGVNGPITIDLGAVGGTSGTISGTRSITAGQITTMRQHGMYINVHSANFTGGEIRGQLGPKRPVDFDGDGRQDYSVLRFPSSGTPRNINYWNLNSTTGVVVSPVFGDALRDFPAPGDYDGDGMDDYALYRAGATLGAQAEFWILTSGTHTVLYYAWGLNGPIASNFNPSDQNVARDYDGDGITDIAVVRRGSTVGNPLVWYIRQSSNGAVRVQHWGTTGAANNAFFDPPVPGDYDGDGKFDLAIYRFGTPTDNSYYVLKSSDGGMINQIWGNFITDYILPGDYDGDGKWDFMAGRTGATGTSPMVWHLLTATGAVSQRTFGISSDLPVQGDYDGDARTDIAIAREGGAAVQTNFWVFNSFTNSSSVVQWGLGADFPVATFDAR